MGRSRAEKVEWAEMIEGAKQATVVSLALLGFFHVMAARESVGVPILIASLVLWWAWLEDTR
jgi:hypothetical protein